eukprot:198346-Amphidinium_carterae.3
MKQKTLETQPRTKTQGNMDWARHYNWPTHHTHRRIWQTTNQNQPQASTRPTNRQRSTTQSDNANW